MLTTVLLFLLTSIVGLTIWWFVIFIKYEKYLCKFSGPSRLPLLGSLHHFRTGKHLLPSITGLVSQYSEPEKIMLGFYPGLAMGDPKTVEFLLSSKTMITKSLEYRYLENWLGTGLLTSTGSKWKKHRRLLTPAFHFQILEQFIEVYDHQSDILIKKFEEAKEEIINVFPYMTLHALDVICEATMNTPINAQLNPTSNYVRSVKEMCRIMFSRALSIKMWDIIYIFSKDYQKEKKALSFLHGLSSSVIEKRREELQKQELGDMTNANGLGTKRRIAFLDILLTSTVDGVPLTNEEIRNEVDTFMFAGHDTTTSALSFTLYCLSKHPEIQDKVFKEITEIFGSEETAHLSYENLQKMKYLEQVIKEVLRMFPPVPLISRILTEDAVYDGKVLPKGLLLIILVLFLHHNPELFPNSYVFDPERFNPENSKKMSLYSYVPFSAGSRNCIGQRFAMLEIKATVSKVLMKFKLLPVLGHQPELVLDAILTSDNGLPIRLEKRRN